MIRACGRSVLPAALIVALALVVRAGPPGDRQKPSDGPGADGNGSPGGPPAQGGRRPGATRLRYQKHVRCVALSPDGRTLASGGDDGVVRFWDIHTGEELRQSGKHYSSIVDVVAFSPDGRTLASAATDPAVHLWDVATGRQTTQFDGGEARTLVFSPDGRVLAAGGGILSSSTGIGLWDMGAGKLLHPF